MNKTLCIFIFICVAFSLISKVNGQDFKSVEPFLEMVQQDSIRAHIKFLADDRLKGRLPGTPQYQMAADYVISQYKRMGLEPAGENNTYLQSVKLRRAKTDKEGTKAELISGAVLKDLVFGEDYVVSPNFEEKSIETTAPLVFVGYGVSEPESGYDDYAGIDVKGKIVMMIAGAPDKFTSSVRSHVMNRTTRIKTALDKGAIGIIVRSSSPGVQSQVNGVLNLGTVTAVGNLTKGLRVSGSVNHALFNSILNVTADEASKIFLSLKDGNPKSFALNSTLRVNQTSVHQDIDSYNIVGLIRGSDKTLQDEYVVYSAHLDHVGVGTPVKGDSIYNGAHDNASGVSCVLEVTRLFSTLKQKPKRSILAVMVTGEEMGLLGSAYFASHPTVPKEKIVANVNMDMPTLIAPLQTVVAFGAPHSSLINPVKSAAAYLQVEVADDPEPEQNRFTRSDQYSFVQQGIPALNVRYVEPAGGTEKVKAWREVFYHQPQDEFSETNFDFDAAKKYVQLCFLIGHQVTQEKTKPSWNKDDLFGKKFGK